MKKFVSIKGKLTVNTMILISVIFVAVLSIVTFINIQTVNRSMAKSEQNIRNALIAKGNTLVGNNSIAMTGMAEDNAFTAMKNLVESTVKEDPDIIYGIYMDDSRFPWVNISPESAEESQKFAHLDDDMAKWAETLKDDHSYKEYVYKNEAVIEFAAPVIADEDIVAGFIRYGISTQSMHTSLQEARADGIRTRNKIVSMLAMLALLSLIISFLLVRRLSDKITQPVASLVESTRIIARGNYDVPVTSDSNDEIGLLIKDVDTMRVAIRDLMENLKEQERLKNEMELARRIQTVLLPKKPEIPGYEIAASSEPADEVGGDYYDVISVAGYDWIVVGDVSGHGVTSGLVMMMVQTAIHTVLVNNPATPPSLLLAIINQVIYGNIQKMDEIKHMTIVVLAGGQNGRFAFSGLHEDILVRRLETGKVETIETDGFWIGMEPDISEMLTTDTLTLAPGDYMVLFTDGVTEARCERGCFFGNRRLVDVIEDSDGENAFEIHADITAAVEPCRKSDDVTILVMKRMT